MKTEALDLESRKILQKSYAKLFEILSRKQNVLIVKNQ